MVHPHFLENKMATKRDPRVKKADAYGMLRRTERRPQHPFSLIFRPYQLQPFMIAPVVPGETMKNLLMQARVVTDPLNPLTKLVGWWQETYFFYVKHRDLGVPDTGINAELQKMVLDPENADMSAYEDADGNAWTYCYPGGVDFLLECVKRITEEYFRDEGENWNTYTLDGVPQVAITGKGVHNWTERLTLASQKRTDNEVNLVEGGSMTPMEFTERWQHWSALREAGLTEMDYQDFVNTYGAQTREAEKSPALHRPELLRYSRNWQYPSNIVEPTTGVPSSALAWSVAERGDKDFRFNEPGFIVGLMCCRPKVYLGNQQGTVVGSMTDVYSWLPAILQQNYEAGYKEFQDDEGPLAATMAEDYWIDLRDLFTGGEQFVNYATPDATVGTANLPLSTGQRRYMDTADVNLLFKDIAVNKIRADGMVHLGIAGRQTKHPGNATVL